MSDIPVIPYGIVRDNYLCVYPSFEYFPSSVSRGTNSLDNLKDNDHKGKISKKVSKKIEKIIYNWISAIEWRRASRKERLFERSKYLTFVTLTLSTPQYDTDKEIKRKLLNRFIIQVQRNHKVKNYLWKAEAQKNGRIHFHILIDRAVHYLDIRKLWNSIQRDHSADYRSNFGTDTNSPNSTDIHALKGLKSMSAYMIKYMQKSEDRRPITGRLWGCSDDLRNLEYCRVVLFDDLNYVIDVLNKSSDLAIREDEYFGIYRPEIYKRIEQYGCNLSKEKRKWDRKQYDLLYGLKTKVEYPQNLLEEWKKLNLKRA